MQNTTHYNLQKPDPNDTYNKATDNSNLDAIDAQMYANAQAATAAQTAANNAQTTANAAVPSSEVGAANGVAPLDNTGKVPTANLPPLNYIPQSAEGAANGVATLDGTGNVPASQLKNVPPVNPATSGTAGTVEIPPSAPAGTPVVPYRAARVQEYELTTTAATAILSFTPAAQGNFSVKLYLRVVTAATNVTITITYTDAGGAQTYTVISNQSLSVGSHTFVAPFFNATASAIAVNVTAGTANQVYASSSIMGE